MTMAAVRRISNGIKKAMKDLRVMTDTVGLSMVIFMAANGIILPPTATTSDADARYPLNIVTSIIVSMIGVNVACMNRLAANNGLT